MAATHRHRPGPNFPEPLTSERNTVSSNAYELKPWTRVAIPHADILEGDFDLSRYAANLGRVDEGSPTCPEVYRDAVSFFAATHLTNTMRDLLAGVGQVLGGASGNRVLQLRTPFGGGKTHTLIALLHLFRNRGELSQAGLFDDLPDPGPTAVVVLPCLDLSSAQGRTVDGLTVRTLWGELAFRLGGTEAYEAIRQSDEERTNPGGDILRRLLAERPTLVLLDEALTYVASAMAVSLGNDSNLGRQTMLFLQNLTEVVRDLPQGALVYSLQKSVSEAVGEEGLLEMLDTLVSRIDAKREPVSGDEVLRVVQRRLFQSLGEPAVRQAVAQAYSTQFEQFLTQNAQSEGDRRQAQDQGETLRRRIVDAYPFHPDLLDLMYHRWGSLPSYQRTRGALQFLATVVGAIQRGEGAGPLIGPGDVPFEDPMVRNTFFSQVGEREAMQAVFASDLLGPNARCRRTDDTLATDVPAYKAFRPGSRLARALALYSFGAKTGEDRGVIKTDLLGSVQMPGLPADVLDVALQHLGDTLLYIHSSGRRFRFEKKANLNKLIDDEIRKVEAREALDLVQEKLAKSAGRQASSVFWPKDSSGIPDRRPRFQVAFLGPEHTLETDEALDRLAKDWSEHCGRAKREYRNALAFALPNAGAMDTSRTAARRILAVQHLLDDRRKQNLDADDVHELGERKKRSETELTAAVRQLYDRVLLPVAAPADAPEPVRLENLPILRFQSLSGGIVDGMLRALENWVFADAVPGKVVSCTQLGRDDLGPRGHWMSGPTLVQQFFGSVHFPKLLDLDGLKRTLAKGITKGTFGLVLGASDDGEHLIPYGPESLAFGKPIEVEDIDLGEGSYLVSAQLAQELDVASRAPTIPSSDAPGGGLTTYPTSLPEPSEIRQTPAPDFPLENTIRLSFRADRQKLYTAFSALQTLTEWADEGFDARVEIVASGTKPIDRNEYEMSVLMTLEEEDIVYREG